MVTTMDVPLVCRLALGSHAEVSLCAVVGYAAVHFGKAHVDRGLLIKAFASYTLLNALVNLVTRRGFGEKVGRRASHPAKQM